MSPSDIFRDRHLAPSTMDPPDISEDRHLHSLALSDTERVGRGLTLYLEIEGFIVARAGFLSAC